LGNQGNAISFINENNGMIVKDLYKLYIKLKQEIPPWFEDMYKRCSEQTYSKYTKNNYNKYAGGGGGQQQQTGGENFTRFKTLNSYNNNSSYNTPQNQSGGNKFDSSEKDGYSGGYKQNNRPNINNYQDKFSKPLGSNSGINMSNLQEEGPPRFFNSKKAEDKK
jgi:hypothetical protein